MPTPEWKTIKALFAGFHTPTIRNLLLLVEAIIEKRTTNLNKLKDALPRLLEGHPSATASNYMRLVRFFKHKRRNLLIERILEANLRLLRPGIPFGDVFLVRPFYLITPPARSVTLR